MNIDLGRWPIPIKIRHFYDIWSLTSNWYLTCSIPYVF